MKFVAQISTGNVSQALRRAGYVFQRQAGEEKSFVRSLARSGFPRFHVYVLESGSSVQINLHLDQKKETYGEAKRHHGEYADSQMVTQEGKRLQSYFD